MDETKRILVLNAWVNQDDDHTWSYTIVGMTSKEETVDNFDTSEEAVQAALRCINGTGFSPVDYMKAFYSAVETDLENRIIDGAANNIDVHGVLDQFTTYWVPTSFDQLHNLFGHLVDTIDEYNIEEHMQNSSSIYDFYRAAIYDDMYCNALTRMDERQIEALYPTKTK